ncbi:hypothetical protein [Haloarcula salinisoli]|uniref:Uncharacterized protein n=1 Tax=Haloarcula salinisoli TaxID=2487746 RepID=A0A8J8CBC9_9EURY|nr:hypothetical protein [Halomicroarcula salinisoli]MBX0306059.1 hypothetical protein [Halomicroarcula salinisoli]
MYDADLPDDTRNSLLRAQRDGDVGAEDIGSVSKRYKQLDDAEADQLDGLIQRQGDDGMEFAAELDGDTLSDLLSCGSRTVGGAAVYATSAGAGVSQSSGCTLDTDFLDAVADVNGKADDFDAQAFARRYNKLEGDNERRFRELAKNDDYGESWMRAVDGEGIESSQIRAGLTRTSDVQEFGEVKEFSTGRQINSEEYPSDWEPVHKKDSIVTEYTLTEDISFQRVYTSQGNKAAGRFLPRNRQDIDNLTPEQIQAKYAIPGDPPDRVAIAQIPKETTMRTGSAAPNNFGSGGGTQYTLPRSEVPPNQFNSNWFDESDDLTKKLNEN